MVEVLTVIPPRFSGLVLSEIAHRQRMVATDAQTIIAMFQASFLPPVGMFSPISVRELNIRKNVQYAIGKKDEAFRLVNDVVAKHPSVVVGHIVRGRLLLADGRLDEADAAAAGHLGPILLILLGIALPLGVIGLIGLASTMSANILDRTREFGVMHAIGALPRTVRRVVVAEAVFLALISVLVAVVPALILTAVLGAGLGNLFMNAPLPYRISFLAAGIWIALVALGAVLASDAAATRASRLTVREALSYL